MAHVKRLNDILWYTQGQTSGAAALVETAVLIEVERGDKAQVQDIILRELPEFLQLFILKNKEYDEGDASSGTALGEKGQFADIWRKIGKLKTAIWDGNEDRLTTESVDEILRDLIGHCFLTLQMRSRSREDSQRWKGREEIVERLKLPEHVGRTYEQEMEQDPGFGDHDEMLRARGVRPVKDAPQA